MRDALRLDTVLFAALENERCLDVRYREVFRPAGRFLNYKVMKQVALKRRFGVLVTPALLLVASLMPLLMLTQWFRALGLSLAQTIGGKRDSSSGEKKKVVWLVPTSAVNESLIRSAIAGVNDARVSTQLISDFTAQLAPRLGFSAVLCLGVSLFRLLGRLVAAHGRRAELLLHARDAVGLMLLSAHAHQRTGDVFITEDHYQRWSFVLSHSAANFQLVQHGVLDHAIAFPHSYGAVRRAYVRDQASADTFRRYYGSVAEVQLHTHQAPLSNNPYSTTGVFIASSFPTLDEEIDFARALQARRIAPIIVKLHPAHQYDGRKSMLLSTADHVCRPDENPACRLFVSHSSSMESSYRGHGVPTISLQREGSTDRAIQAVVQQLKHRDERDPL